MGKEPVANFEAYFFEFSRKHFFAYRKSSLKNVGVQSKDHGLSFRPHNVSISINKVDYLGNVINCYYPDSVNSGCSYLTLNELKAKLLKKRAVINARTTGLHPYTQPMTE